MRQHDIDPWGPLRDLQRRIEMLERANPLNNSSIDSGSGLRVGTAAGIHVDPDASITAGEAQLSGGYGGRVGAGGTWVSADGAMRNDGGTIGIGSNVDMADTYGIKAGAAELSTKFGGHVKAGTTTVGSDGVIRNADGEVVFGNKVAVVGGIKASGQIDPQSVLMSWGAARHTIEQVTGFLQGDINTVSGRTTTAQNRADSAYGRADDAYSLASTKASTARVDAVNFKLNEVIDAVNDLEAFVRSQHPSKPLYPPIVKD